MTTKSAPSIPEDIVEPLYTAVGHLVVNWALMEQNLELWVTVVYHDADGKAVDRRLPRNFSRKTSFLRKRFTDIPALAQFKEEGSNLIARMSKLKEIRDHIVHGVLSAYNPNGHRLTFRKLDVVDGETMQQENNLTISLQHLLNAGIEAQDLTSDAYEFARRMMETLDS